MSDSVTHQIHALTLKSLFFFPSVPLCYCNENLKVLYKYYHGCPCLLFCGGIYSDLPSVWFVHQEDLAPDLDPGGFPLWAPPPGEAGQRLARISEPVFRRLGNRMWQFISQIMLDLLTSGMLFRLGTIATKQTLCAVNYKLDWEWTLEKNRLYPYNWWGYKYGIYPKPNPKKRNMQRTNTYLSFLHFATL